MSNQQTPPPQHGRKAGRMMLIVAWLVGMVLLTQMFGNWERRQYNPNQSPVSQRTTEGRIQVALERNAQGHYVTEGQVNGRSMTFLLDTGATDIVIPEDVADELNLERQGTGYAMTANGMVEVYRTTLDRVSIGDIVLYNVPASINPGMNAQVEILLGMSALRQLEFVQRDGVLTLIQ